MASNTPLRLEQISSKTPCFTGPNAAILNLSGGGEFDDVVYLLRCKPQISGGAFTWYVGRSPRCKLALRMKQHFAGSATDYTAQNKPLLVEALYPAARRSTEAYVFFSMMEALPVAAMEYGRLGGWTQTRPKPSQLCLMLLKEQKRMLSDSCLACGSNRHFAKDKACPRYGKWPESTPVNCDHCKAIVDITALGKTRTRPPAAVAATAPLAVPPDPSPSTSNGTKRPRSASTAPPQKAQRLKAPEPKPLVIKPAREYARAKVCGNDYTTLAWFLGKFAGEKVRKAVADNFEARALMFRRGDHKTLTQAGFAKPQRPKELLPGRSNLSADWLDTACKAARPPHKPLQICRGCDGRNVLWRVDDLKEFFE